MSCASDVRQLNWGSLCSRRSFQIVRLFFIWVVALMSGEHRLPACSSRQLAAKMLGCFASLRCRMRSASCRTLQAGSLRSQICNRARCFDVFNYTARSVLAPVPEGEIRAYHPAKVRKVRDALVGSENSAEQSSRSA